MDSQQEVPSVDRPAKLIQRIGSGMPRRSGPGHSTPSLLRCCQSGQELDQELIRLS
jgi:hypothetical protein